MMRVLHIADLHLGAGDHHGPRAWRDGFQVSLRAADEIDRLMEIAEIVEREGVELVLCAGDVFDSRAPSHTAKYFFQRFLGRLTRVGATIVVVPGNHDGQVAPQVMTPLDVLGAANFERFVLLRGFPKPEGCTYHYRGRGGEAYIVGLPWIFKQVWQARHQSAQSAVLQVRERLEALAEAGVRMRVPVVLLAHVAMHEGKMFRNLEAVANLGDDVLMFNVAHLRVAPWQYVALGHYHDYQSIENAFGVPFVYAGSIERRSYIEEGVEKGVVMIEAGEGDRVWGYRFVGLRARPLLRIRIALQAHESGGVMARILEELGRYRDRVADAIVRVEVACWPGQESGIETRLIEGMLQEQGAAWVERPRVIVERRATIRERTPQWIRFWEQDKRVLLRHYLHMRGYEDEARAGMMEIAEQYFTQLEQGQ